MSDVGERGQAKKQLGNVEREHPMDDVPIEDPVFVSMSAPSGFW